MAASRRRLAALAIAAASLAACDALLGLGSYSKVDCAFDCGVGEGGEAGAIAETGPDDVGTPDSGQGDAADADADVVSMQDDAGDAADGDADAGPTGDGGWDGPTLAQRWAQWPMPNPDASAGIPDSGALLPNPMAYDAGFDGGASTVVDLVTGLVWQRGDAPAADFKAAAAACAALPGPNWHVPSRIQLASLLDTTHQPTIDPSAFPGTSSSSRYWTSSPVPVAADAGALYWTVDFGTGLVAIFSGASQVRCVQEP